ncbi:MAG TPA: isopentenyl transferase family protein [Chthonomonadaceae bacterium]|nr:isopentenyl transferase family protein [Chthonomonadaceae bacterium]
MNRTRNRRTRQAVATARPRREERPPPQPQPPPDAPRVLVIFGPTSSGKTALSLELAESLPAALGQEIEVVSADSRQVYVGMNIGTSKVSREVMLRVPHHCLDMRPPDRMVSLAEYQALAIRRITEIHARGRLPVLVGGTGSYVLSVVENWNVGEELLAEETNYRARGKGPPLFRAAFIRPATSLDAVMRRIDRAVEAMIEAGLVEEVVSLAERYRLWDPARLNRNALWHTHGYREFLERAHAQPPIRLRPTKRDLPGIIAAIQEHTRAYAHRQWSWLKKMPPVKPVASGKKAVEAVKELLAADE